MWGDEHLGRNAERRMQGGSLGTANVSLTQNPRICGVQILRGRIIQSALPKPVDRNLQRKPIVW
jgi:hypothetical protein